MSKNLTALVFNMVFRLAPPGFSSINTRHGPRHGGSFSSTIFIAIGPPRTKLTTNSEESGASLISLPPLIVRLHGRIFFPPLQRRCNLVRGNIAKGEVRWTEPRRRMSNERFIRLGQRCGNSLGMPRQGQNLGTDRQSPYPVSSPEEMQLVPEVTTGRVKKSEVTVRSPALLFSFSQRNKNVSMPEDGHKQNRLCKVRKQR